MLKIYPFVTKFLQPSFEASTSTSYVQFESKRSLYSMSRIVWGFSVLLLIMGFGFDAEVIRNLSLMAWLISSGVFVLLRQRQYVIAAWVMSIMLMSTAFIAAYLGFGILDVAILLLPIGVTFAGMILPIFQIWYAIVFSTGLSAILAYIQWSGGLPNPIDYPIETVDFIVFPVLVFGSQLLMLYTTYRLRTSLSLTQKEKLRWQTIFQSAQDGMLILNSQDRILDVNPALQDWLGPFLRMSDEGWILEEGLQFWQSQLDFGSKFDWEIPSYGTTPARVCEIVRQSIQFQDEHIWVCTIRDVTEDRALRSQLLQEDTVKIMGKLSTTVAHDLNNHLASILALSDVLQMTDTEAERQQVATEIGETALRAGKRTSQILSSVRNNPKALKLVRPRRLMNDLVKAVQVRIPKNVRFEYVPTTVYNAILMDRTRVFDAMFNLVLNALDAVEGRQNPSVRVGCDAIEGGIQLWVEDNGIGMNEEELVKVREAFFTTKDKGTGLGLFSVEMCAAAHGGRLHIQSSLGEGSLFQLFLPSKSSELSIELTQPMDLSHLRNQLQQYQVLLVEDNEPLGMQIKKDLERSQMNVHWLTTGAEAIQALRQSTKWDVLIIDFRLPDQTGLDVLQASDGNLPPTIAISGDVTAWDASSKRFPIVSKISKPFRVGQLIDVIQMEMQG